jgi:hypothetical protein
VRRLTGEERDKKKFDKKNFDRCNAFCFVYSKKVDETSDRCVFGGLHVDQNEYIKMSCNDSVNIIINRVH